MKNSANRSEKTGQFLFVCLFVCFVVVILGGGLHRRQILSFFHKRLVVNHVWSSRWDWSSERVSKPMWTATFTLQTTHTWPQTKPTDFNEHRRSKSSRKTTSHESLQLLCFDGRFASRKNWLIKTTNRGINTCVHLSTKWQETTCLWSVLENTSHYFCF